MNTARLSTLSVLAITLGLAATASRAADTYSLDPVHSSFIFKIKHMNVSNLYGRINGGTGTLVIDDADPTKSTIEIELKPENIDTFNDKRDQHLKGPDFFNAKQFPTITFKSKAVKKVDDSTLEVTGDFTLLGVAKEVTGKFTKIGAAKDPWGGFRTGYEGALTIKRSDFGMKQMLEAVGDDVPITVSIEAVKNK